MSKGLSREQLQHAKDRLQVIEDSEYAAIVAACWLEPPPVLSILEVWQGIKKGKILLRESVDGTKPIREYHLVGGLFNVDTKTSQQRDQKKYGQLLAAHRKKWSALYDQLVLSNAPDALKLIQSLTP